MNIADLAWLAGLLEGEGCFSVRGPFPSRPTRRPALTISLQMLDEDVVQRAAQLMGGSMSKYQRAREGDKPIYRTEISGARSAALMTRLMPLMGSRRTARITELLNKEGLSHHAR